MELKVVKLEDVYPDSGYNPREDFGDIDALAATFAANTARPGEPYEPPVVLRDGQIYWLRDGERRWRAMRSIGTERFLARVCDTEEEAGVAIAVASDNKKLLSEVEKSRGVQMMLQTGVAPMVVEKAAGFKGAQRVRRAMARVGDAAADMSLDRMLAIDEFADDPRAVSELTKAGEGSWRYVLASLRRKRRNKEREDEFRKVATDHGCLILDANRDWSQADPPLTCYPWPDDPHRPARFTTPEALDGFLEAADPEWGEPGVVIDLRPGADVYFPKRERQEPAPEPALAKRGAALAAAMRAEQGRQRAWASELFRSGETARRASLGPDLRSTFLDEVMTADFDEWPELEGCALSAIDYAQAWERARAFAFDERVCAAVVGVPGTAIGAWHAEHLLGWLDWLDAIEEAGCPKSDESQLIRAEIEAWREREDGGEEDADGER